MAKMPHLVEMDKRSAKKGLRIVGAHVQSATEEQILEVAKEYKVGFAITEGANGPIAVNGIPHMVVFDVDGKLVYSGYPSDDADDIIRKELRRVADTGEDATGTSGSGIFSSSDKKETALIAERNWTNTEGNTIRATLLSVSGADGRFRRSDGKEFSYALSKLSDADRELIREAQAKADGAEGADDDADPDTESAEEEDDPIGLGN